MHKPRLYILLLRCNEAYTSACRKVQHNAYLHTGPYRITLIYAVDQWYCWNAEFSWNKEAFRCFMFQFSFCINAKLFGGYVKMNYGIKFCNLLMTWRYKCLKIPLCIKNNTYIAKTLLMCVFSPRPVITLLQYFLKSSVLNSFVYI